MAVFISECANDTLLFGERFASTLNNGDVVLLQGELGAGKTLFAKGVARGLGIEEEVLSPTYAYMNAYGDKLYHFDFYRLSSGRAAEELGLCDYFYAGGVCLIEWGENVKEILPENCKRVIIEKLSDKKRRIIYG